MKKLLLIAILLLPGWAWGATWYVRPVSGEYGAEDGSTYEAAFDGFADITWGEGGVTDSDTLIVCGEHWEELANQKSSITLDLRCAANSDPATIYGSKQITSGWSEPDGNGEYTIAHNPTEGSTFYGPVVVDGVILDSEGTPGSLTAGQWGWAADVLYLKTDPTSSTVEVGDRWQCISQGDYTITGLTILGGTLKYPHKHGVGSNNTATAAHYGDLVINGTTFVGPQEQAVNTYHSSGPPSKMWDNVSILNCTITDSGGEAIYLKSINTSATVSGTTIGGTKIGWSGNGGTSDFRGDGIQVGEPGASFTATISNNTINAIDGSPIRYIGTNATISGNLIYDCGCDSYGTQPSSDNYCMSITPESNAVEGDAILIEKNLIVYSGDIAHGIRLSRGSAYTPPPITLRNNIISMAGDANSYDGIHHYKSETVYIYHNTVIGPRYAYRIYSDNGEITGAVKNNIFQARFPFYCAETDINGLAFEYNLLYDTQSEANPFYANGNYATVAAMDTALDWTSNNIEGNPLLTNYHPASNSPAVNAGTNVGVTIDYRGIQRPIGAGFDIGAIEYFSGIHFSGGVTASGISF